MSFELGRRPETLRVFLVQGDDHRSELELLDADAAYGGVPPVLVFATGSFPAELIEDGDVASFTIPAAAVAALAALEDRSVVLKHLGITLARGRFDVV